jgi:hypothetical protein
MRQLNILGFVDAVTYVHHVAAQYQFVALEPDGRITVIRESRSLYHHVVCQWDQQLRVWSVTTAIPKNNMRKANIVWKRD